MPLLFIIARCSVLLLFISKFTTFVNEPQTKSKKSKLKNGGQKFPEVCLGKSLPENGF